MIGWTKSRKRCKTHGLVLRGRPVWIVLPSILMFFFGMMFVLDVRGCQQEGRKQDAIAQKIAQENMATMPSEWKTIYAGMGACGYHSEAILPHLSPEQIRLFLNLIQTGEQDDAFALITDHMKSADRDNQ